MSEERRERGHIGRAQPVFAGLHVALDLFGFGRAGDHARDLALREQPAERQIEQLFAARFGECIERLDLAERFVVEETAGALAPQAEPRIFARFLTALVLAGQQPAREWEIGQKAGLVFLATQMLAVA